MDFDNYDEEIGQQRTSQQQLWKGRAFAGNTSSSPVPSSSTYSSTYSSSPEQPLLQDVLPLKSASKRTSIASTESSTTPTHGDDSSSCDDDDAGTNTASYGTAENINERSYKRKCDWKHVYNEVV